MKDPVYGCVGAISVLQRQVHKLQQELDSANADLLSYACSDIPTRLPLGPSMVYQAERIDQFYPAAASSTATLPVSYRLQWADAGEINASIGGDGDQGGESRM